MTLAVRLTPRAEADLAEIWDHSATRWGVSQADAYLAGLGAALDLLAEYPDIARERIEFSPPLRLHPYRSHLIVYQAQLVLDVVRVLSNRTDWAALFIE